MIHLGFALHTVQDSTSDEHHNFKLWTGSESGLNQALHGIQEAYGIDPIKSNFARATCDVIDWFEGKQKLPEQNVDIFSKYGEDRFVEHLKWKAQKMFSKPGWL